MKILLSPAKKMKMTDACPVSQQHLSEPPLHAQALEIARLLKECTLPELGKVLGASGATLQHAATLYHQFATGMQPDQAALFAYTGTAYTALNPISLSSDTLQFAQDHLRILSGLYGILRPFDRIEEYRLDVGNKLKIDEYKNLYDFWRDPV
ncbi:MAG: YaaA family protein, partial [Bacteroidales bacterium]